MPTPITSEDAILARIARHFPAAPPSLLLGRGDDCCVLPAVGPLCVSTDLFLEDVHFRRAYFTPEDIGWKALAVNLSDLAASGARPQGFTLGLALPPDATMELVDGVFAGMAELAARHDVPLAGGDLARAERLHLCLTVFGVSEAPGGALRRAVAEPGDLVFLVGRTGLARVGLARLEASGRAMLHAWPEAAQAHLRPEPRLKEGLRLAALAAQGARLGLMDVSDGLARDLPRLLGPRLGAEITLPAPHEELVRHASANGAEDAAACAFLGGEDYALAGTCAPKDAARLMAYLPDVTLLGRVTATPGITCNGRTAGSGFDHFGA